MQITLLKNDQLEIINLSYKHKGDYVVNDEINAIKKPILKIFASGNDWYVQSLVESVISVGQYTYHRCLLVPQKIYSIYVPDHKHKILLIPESCDKDMNIFQKFKMKTNCILIGRSNDCDICYAHPFISYRHARLSFEQDVWYIEDLKSTNGIFVNQRRVKNTKLSFGDVIYIMGLRIIIADTCFTCNRIHEIRLSKNIYKYTYIKFQKKITSIGREIYRPSLRTESFPSSKEYVIESPPLQNEVRKTPLLYTLGPSITMALASFCNLLLQVADIQNENRSIRAISSSLVMSLSMIMSILFWPLLTKFYENRQRRKIEQERRQIYLTYLSDTINDINDEKDAIHAYFSQVFPPFKKFIERIYNKDSLWNIESFDSHFLSIRLGTGNVKMNLAIHFPKNTLVYNQDTITNELKQIKESIYNQENSPILLSLQQFWKIGIVGNHSNSYMYSLLLQLCILYKYTDLNIILIINEYDEETYKLRWLPHITSYEWLDRFIIKGPKHALKMSTHFIEIFNKQRENQNISSHFIFVNFTQDIKLEIVDVILNSNQYKGFSYFQVADSYHQIDSRVSSVLKLENKIGTLIKQGESNPLTFQVEYLEKLELYEASRMLANLKLEKSQNEVSGSISFLALFSVDTVEQLDVLDRWHSFDNCSLKTPLGIDANGEIIYLDLHERVHGPHGLFAGMTGSGKSECIITYLLSLCINYHPDFIGIILIDYKGGGTSLSLSDLPHIKGIITNLDGGEIYRYLKSIECEIIRRQRIFQETAFSLGLREIDIYQYHSLYQKGLVKEAIPHLLIVCDEFAELKRQQPQFMEQLISASRIGRSLGVHLILATQKPTGVVDEQIWSNTRFRICLKVADRSDSIDMIKSEDAIYLQKTGSFYFQVGYNEIFLKGQSAWAKAPYFNQGKGLEDKKICAIDSRGNSIYEYNDYSVMYPLKEDTQLQRIVDHIMEVSRKKGIERKGIWMPCLPESIDREDICYSKDEHERLIAVIGKVDDIEGQCYQNFSISILEDKRMVLLGNEASSKTMFLVALLYEYLANYSNEELQIHIIDFENESLASFQQAKQIVDIIFVYEEEKIRKFFNNIKQIIMQRKHSQEFPIILLLIHNYALLKEYYSDLELELMYFMREGSKVGVSIILTANAHAEISYRISQYVNRYYALQLQDQNEYRTIFQTTQLLRLSECPGRGMYKQDKIYEFQVNSIMKDDIEKLLHSQMTIK